MLCCLQELWIVYETNGFSSGSDASENNCFVLRLFFYQKAKISRDTSVGARIFSGGFLHLFQDKSRSLFNGCKNQSKKVHVLFAISKPLLEYGTNHTSSEKYIVFAEL